MNTLGIRTVADLVTENIKTAHVFKKHGIDFCCGGGITIDKACEKYKVNPADLERDLLTVNTSGERAVNYNSWDLDFLADHIINIHHSYVSESIPLLLQYAEKVVRVHGHHYTELIEIRNLLMEVAGELSAHMRKEELILIPFIKKMVQAQKEGTTLAPAHFGTVDNPIAMMENEHEEAGEKLRQISKLSSGYTPPAGACNTYRAFYAMLDEFEQDLHQHIHLENNILFPKSLLLEKEVTNKTK